MSIDNDWAMPMIDIIRQHVPEDVDPTDAMGDGLFLMPDVSSRLRLALLADGYLEHTDGTGVFWIPSKTAGQCGLQFAADESDDSFVWVFYDHHR